MKKDPIFTYQTHVQLDEGGEAALAKAAEHLSLVERFLFADYARGKDISLLKSEYLQKHGITARQFNAIRLQLEGKIESIVKLRDEQIARLPSEIEKVKKLIVSLKKKNKEPSVIDKKIWKQERLEKKLSGLLEDKRLGKVRLCFGSQKLFRAQFHLEENGYLSHEEWKEDWDKKRNDSFFTLGSKDEMAGNQTCVATLCEDGTLTLKLRLPDALKLEHGRYLIIEKVYFAYGHAAVVAALESCEQRQKLKSEGNTSHTLYGQAISYRFKQGDNNKWYVFASTSLAPVATCTHKERGTIGIDINADHIALVETGANGNPIYAKCFPLTTYGKSSEQAEALIGDVVAQVVSHAIDVQKPLVLEDLDFTEKKESLKKSSNASYARMLSSFVYNKIITSVQSRGYRTGVEVLSVNPAFTSVIGRIKYAVRYGLTIHEAAALCIARRGLGVSEKMPRRLDHIPTGKGDYVSLTLPARNRAKNKRPSWTELSKKLRAELAARVWAKKKEPIHRSSKRAA